MANLSDDMVTHNETFDDVGNVHLYIQDMNSVWKARREEVRITVEQEEAIFVLESYINIAPHCFVGLRYQTRIPQNSIRLR